jgi:hypothetical protein
MEKTMQKENVKALVEQIVPNAHDQAIEELTCAIMAALMGTHPVLDINYSDAGCVLISGLALAHNNKCPHW